jgi:uncharacterized protein YqjF (DUF2071 family)
MRQRWAHLLFLHWAVHPSYFDDRLPPELTLDTFEGMAYIGLIPFTMTGIRPPWSPAIPGISDFHETNLRTYVHCNGKDPGVWFFSLDAGNPVGAQLGRRLWNLPYHRARMEVETRPDGTVHYRSERLWPPPTPAESHIVCRPIGHPAPSKPGTLEHFLLERYLLYARKNGQLYRGQVHHSAYPAQRAELIEMDESLIQAAGFERPAEEPLIHYASEVNVHVFPLVPVK